MAASLAASVLEKTPLRFSSIRLSRSLATVLTFSCETALLPVMTWRTTIPNAKTSLFSVNRPVVAYSGARYPIAALAFRVEKTTSSARSLCSPGTDKRGVKWWSRRIFSADMFWCTTDGLLAFLLCMYSTPANHQNPP
ncbi:Os06g0134750 [Oryza sativa Japonica Group]|uniref:Os06g0134750 protein n=1 Tax=Oryza sativa subsp. japonica TaxID=39947 RepID=A0A0P0WS50_ORYSJ|nr:hypothetical protein EE612_031775 [Oryza sativa]BAS96019.1 Os06g0134750 [Oryza sativa Japonica Group]